MRSTATRRAPSRATRPVRASRLVTTTTHSPEPGRRSRTCLVSRASSSSRSIRRPASSVRNRAAHSSAPTGSVRPSTPSACSRRCRASRGRRASTSYPRRSRYSCPSGNRSATRCPQCTASAVLPAPAVPAPAATTVTGAAAGRGAVSRSSRAASWSCRPTKSGTSAGSCRGTAASRRSGARRRRRRSSATRNHASAHAATSARGTEGDDEAVQHVGRRERRAADVRVDGRAGQAGQAAELGQADPGLPGTAGGAAAEQVQLPSELRQVGRPVRIGAGRPARHADRHPSHVLAVPPRAVRQGRRVSHRSGERIRAESGRMGRRDRFVPRSEPRGHPGSRRHRRRPGWEPADGTASSPARRRSSRVRSRWCTRTRSGRSSRWRGCAWRRRCRTTTRPACRPRGCR